MIEYADIDTIKPAPYNPRRIEEQQIEQLKSSFNDIGFILPVLVNRKNNVIIAGHQRTKTAKLCGITKIPVMYVDKIVLGDEIKFNQLHNGIDKTLNNSQTLLKDYKKQEFIEIDNADFTNENAFATIVNEICKLLLKYGNALSCVICKNKVIYGCEYVKACKMLNLKVNSYILPDDKFEKVVYYLNLQYGKYYYGDIERKTYVQGLAQLNRSVEKREDIKQNKSTLYTYMVLPYLEQRKEDISILDFGCGKGAYINSLAKKYKYALGLEFYNNNGKAINISKGNKQIDNLIKYIDQNKYFDVVVCDSVLNSVDSLEAEESVITCLNLFTNDRLFISGRTTEGCKIWESKNGNAIKNRLTFLDDHNFTSTYREGQWYFQHFHNKDEMIKELQEKGLDVINVCWNKYGTTFQIEAKKVKQLSNEQYIKALDFEFNLPLPNNKTYNRNLDIKKVLKLS